ncbi:putative methyltransferase (plasmid) [Piscirickettsia salmonis]|uniref:methyltransferase domain-containing protein n=3 Tax=Piscirickettsia salmonis TaxID=1238 RepID=UPI000332D046|nr:methyltransferase domain-containing protein [Piscirickettsia salmonis]ERL60606.1 ribosomal RNA adenine dimethylase family protein [Piscirickettsia salmonis LF-89 = ATCC VR-1361]PEQ16999.1 hypothetical protein X973_04405 [Piscirickettsia salmonis]QGN79363.1 putative methyltransferase [Piscirickettsia salmonis]QGN82952.1 putative methyltransferase [Piscirickettsia salmonis]QGN86467.1 putative methyltransferase [Piscirickettsia salmonis]
MSYILQHSSSGLKRLALQHEIYRESSELLLKKSGIQKNMRVLEIGTGGAELSAWLTNFLSLGKLLSIDISEDYVDLANQSINSNRFKAVQKDIYHIDSSALLRKIIVSFRKVIFLCSLLRIKQLIQIIYQ